jgi:hypothetical protein
MIYVPCRPTAQGPTGFSFLHSNEKSGTARDATSLLGRPLEFRHSALLRLFDLFFSAAILIEKADTGRELNLGLVGRYR